MAELINDINNLKLEDSETCAQGSLAEQEQAKLTTIDALMARKVSSPELLQELKSAVLGFWPNRKNNHFPGPLPISIERKNFATIKKYPYVISLKTDGIRFLLMLHNKIAYMVDRNFNFYVVTVAFHDSIYGSSCNICDGTGLILDGEVIVTNGLMNYIVHDCVCLFSRDHTQEQLPTRYEAIHTALSLWYPDKSEININAKTFYKHDDFKAAMLDKTEHKIDGIILTPVDKEIGTHTQPTLFKWKFKHTVDLKVHEEGDEYVSYVLDRQRLIKYASVKKSNDSFRTKLYKNCSGFVNGDIVECVINMEEHSFDPLLIRFDKSHPNSLSTVEKTILNAKENISLSEILENMS
jgi:hypothetical protein